MVEQLARAGETRATSMEEERHVAAKLVRSLLNQRVVLGDAPQASYADKRRRRVGRAAAQAALVRDVLLDANVNRVVVRNIGLACEQVDRLEHDVLTHGNVERRHSPTRVATDRNENITRRASARRVRWRTFFGRLEHRSRGDDVGTFHVQDIVKRHGMKDGRHVVIPVIATISDAQKQVHLRRSHKLKPRALDLRRARNGDHIDRDLERGALTTHAFSLFRDERFT